MATAMPAVHAGRVRYIAITNEARAPLAPEIETATEAGYSELTLTGLEGFFGWRDMPTELRDRISGDIQSVAADRTVSDRIAALGYVANGSTPAKYAAALEEQRAKVASIIKMTGAKPQ
jgi:tripartite-type tricarboxylate transporter receptor subunit TctC